MRRRHWVGMIRGGFVIAFCVALTICVCSAWYAGLDVGSADLLGVFFAPIVGEIAARRVRGRWPAFARTRRLREGVPTGDVADAGVWSEGAWVREHGGREHWIVCSPRAARAIVKRALAAEGVRRLAWTLTDIELRTLLSWSVGPLLPWVLRRTIVPVMLFFGLGLLPIVVVVGWPLAALGAIAYRKGGSVRAEIGSDGVMLRTPLWRRWIRFTQIRRVTSGPEGVVLSTVDGDVVLPLKEACERRALAAELERRMRRAKSDVRALRVLDEIGTRAHGDRYRVAPLPSEALLEVALSPEHAPADRVRAACRLESEAGPLAEQAWTVLDACVEPTTRRAVALERGDRRGRDERSRR